MRSEAVTRLAEFLRATDRPAKALPLYRRALATIETRLGPKHAACCGARRKLGRCLAALGENEEASRVLKRALDLSLAAFGEDHVEVALVLCQYAQVVLKLGDEDKALGLFERSHAIHAKRPKAELGDAATALHALSTKRLCDDRTAAGVLQTCCGGEPTYNPLYAAVAKLRRGESKDFAFGLKLACWDAFKASDASEDARKAARRAANLGKFCAALMGSELPLATAFAKVEARSLMADAAVKVAVLSALRGLLAEASDSAFAGALSLEPSPGAVTVAPFAQTRLKRPAGADAGAWAAREAELVAWFEGGGGE